MTKKESYELFQKVSEFKSSKLYEFPKISAEGYGSFVNTYKESKIKYEKINELWKSLLTSKSKNSTYLLLKAFTEFLDMHTETKYESSLDYLKIQAKLISKLEEVNLHSKYLGTKEFTSIIDWVLLNLKLNTLLKENDFFSKPNEIYNFDRVTKTLKEIRYYYEKYLAFGTNLVAIDDLSTCIRKKISKIPLM